MQTMVLTWRNKEGELLYKEYTDTKQLAKARSWLAKNGAYDIDVAVRLKKVA